MKNLFPPGVSRMTDIADAIRDVAKQKASILDEHNIYLAFAEEQWKSGADGEDIARDLARAFKAVAQQGIGDAADIVVEFKRLLDL